MNKWYPISSRYPNHLEKVIIQRTSGSIILARYSILTNYFSYEEKDEDGDWYTIKVDDVAAWQPIPNDNSPLWIPIGNGKCPLNREDILVQRYYDGIFIVRIAIYSTILGFYYEEKDEDGDWCSIKIDDAVAWMPLPNRYSPSSNNHNSIMPSSPNNPAPISHIHNFA